MPRAERALSGGALALAAALSAGPAAAQELRLVPVPSGQEVRLIEVFLDPQEGDEGLWIRFRFLAPGIAAGPGAVPFEVAAADMEHLCAAFALPLIAARGLAPDLVVISLSDRPVAFGQTDPAATQYFEAFVIDGEDCLWEPF